MTVGALSCPCVFWNTSVSPPGRMLASGLVFQSHAEEACRCQLRVRVCVLGMEGVLCLLSICGSVVQVPPGSAGLFC